MPAEAYQVQVRSGSPHPLAEARTSRAAAGDLHATAFDHAVHAALHAMQHGNSALALVQSVCRPPPPLA